MKDSRRLKLLSLIAVVSKNLFILPAVLLLRAVIFGNSGGIPALLLYFSFVAIGFIAGTSIFKEDSAFFEKIGKAPFLKLPFFVLNIKEKGRFISNIAGFVFLLLPVITAFVFCQGQGILRLIFEVFFTVLPYLIALRSSYRTYSEILANNVAYFGFFLIAAAIIAASYLQQGTPLKPYFYVVMYIYILFFLVLRNQEDIDSNIYSKRYIQKSILPGNMRGFNLLAVLVLFSAIMLLFNLKAVVMILMDAAVKLLGLIIRAIVWILNHIFPATESDQPGAQQAPPDLGMFGDKEKEAIHPVLNLLGNTFKTFIILYALYKLIPFLLKKAFAAILKLVAFLKMYFKRYEVSQGAYDYDDEIESIKPAKEIKKRQNTKKSLEGAKRDLRTATDPVERVRLIYGILLKMLEVCGVMKEKADTTGEIYMKSGKVEGVNIPFHSITSLYDRVRYGGRTPDRTELSAYEENYAAAAEKIKLYGNRRENRT